MEGVKFVCVFSYLPNEKCTLADIHHVHALVNDSNLELI